jgi:hypothetical protein
VFDDVRGAIDSLERMARGLDADCLDGSDAAELVAVATRGERICAALKTVGARRVEKAGTWKASGQRSAAHWIAEHTGETVGAATQTLETARRLEELSATDEAFRAGELSATQASEIASAAEADPHAETELLATAAETSVKGLRDKCRQVRAGAEADDLAWARRLHTRRRFSDWTSPDGAYCFSGQLAPDAGARFRSALQPHIDRIFRDARKAGRREPRAAYAADALVALATEGPCRPTECKVTVESAALARGHTEPGERCEIDGIGPVPVTTARGLLDDAAISVLVKDGDDITAVTRKDRTIPAKIRRALEAKYPVCGVKSCANDQFLEIDHVQALQDGGVTALYNLWRICKHHHILKTLFGWIVTGDGADRDLVPP